MLLLKYQMESKTVFGSTSKWIKSDYFGLSGNNFLIIVSFLIHCYNV